MSPHSGVLSSLQPCLVWWCTSALQPCTLVYQFTSPVFGVPALYSVNSSVPLYYVYHWTLVFQPCTWCTSVPALPCVLPPLTSHLDPWPQRNRPFVDPRTPSFYLRRCTWAKCRYFPNKPLTPSFQCMLFSPSLPIWDQQLLIEMSHWSKRNQTWSSWNQTFCNVESSDQIVWRKWDCIEASEHVEPGAAQPIRASLNQCKQVTYTEYHLPNLGTNCTIWGEISSDLYRT